MPVNEFEHEVQQKMEELQLVPSAAVWTEVEKRIRREKKRRRALLWWLLPLALAGGLTLIIRNRSQRAENISDNQPVPGKEQAIPAQPPAANTPAETEQVPVNTRKETGDEKNKPVMDAREPLPATAMNSSRPPKKTAPVPGSSSLKKPKTRTLAGINNNTAAAYHQPIPSRKMDTATHRPPDAIDPYPSFSAPPAIAADKTDAESLISPVKAETKAEDSLANVDQKEQVMSKTEKPADAPPVRIQPKKHWEFGITTGFGTASRKESLQIGAAEKALYSSQVPVTGIGPLPGPGGIPSSQQPGSLLNGPYFEAGLYARKNLSRRFAFSAGLELEFFGTRQQTGEFTDSAASFFDITRAVRSTGYYHPGVKNVFHNRYWLSTVPLTLEWKLNKGDGLPVYWENGLTPGLIASTRSLIYSPTSGVYYQDRTAYQRFQLFYHSGISLRMAAASRHPFTARLQMQYGLTGLQKERTTQQNHLFSIGLHLRYTIKK